MVVETADKICERTGSITTNCSCSAGTFENLGRGRAKADEVRISRASRPSIAAIWRLPITALDYSVKLLHELLRISRRQAGLHEVNLALIVA
jgi:hypothetical protein